MAEAFSLAEHAGCLWTLLSHLVLALHVCWGRGTTSGVSLRCLAPHRQWEAFVSRWAIRHEPLVRGARAGQRLIARAYQ